MPVLNGQACAPWMSVFLPLRCLSFAPSWSFLWWWFMLPVLRSILLFPAVMYEQNPCPLEICLQKSALGRSEACSLLSAYWGACIFLLCLPVSISHFCLSDCCEDNWSFLKLKHSALKRFLFEPANFNKSEWNTPITLPTFCIFPGLCWDKKKSDFFTYVIQSFPSPHCQLHPCLVPQMSWGTRKCPGGRLGKKGAGTATVWRKWDHEKF